MAPFPVLSPLTARCKASILSGPALTLGFIFSLPGAGKETFSFSLSFFLFSYIKINIEILLLIPTSEQEQVSDTNLLNSWVPHFSPLIVLI